MTKINVDIIQTTREKDIAIKVLNLAEILK